MAGFFLIKEFMKKLLVREIIEKSMIWRRFPVACAFFEMSGPRNAVNCTSLVPERVRWVVAEDLLKASREGAGCSVHGLLTELRDAFP